MGSLSWTQPRRHISTTSISDTQGHQPRNLKTAQSYLPQCQAARTKVRVCNYAKVCVYICVDSIKRTKFTISEALGDVEMNNEETEKVQDALYLGSAMNENDQSQEIGRRQWDSEGWIGRN